MEAKKEKILYSGHFVLSAIIMAIILACICSLGGCGFIDWYKNKYRHDNPIEEAAEELVSKSLLGGQEIDFTPDSQEPDSPEP